MKFNILTLFPELFSPYLETGVIGRAVKQGIITTKLVNIRDFTNDNHKTVDGTPYGGGPGMVMKVEPIDKALSSLYTDKPRAEHHVIVLSARGKQFTQAKAEELKKLGKDIVFICGRYEGIDQRVADNLADEELSVGPYVLAGGELPAMIILETMSRLIPGVLGNPESLADESFNDEDQEYPQYTKPEEYNGWKVPPVLLSGNHGAIKTWRSDQKNNTMPV